MGDECVYPMSIGRPKFYEEINMYWKQVEKDILKEENIPEGIIRKTHGLDTITELAEALCTGIIDHDGQIQYKNGPTDNQSCTK